jgi:ABC-2 type transport system ATP-binding protein
MPQPTPDATTGRPSPPQGAPGESILRTENLSKRFGSIVAVDRLNLEVRAGEVHGFLGPNGSGKSTTVGMILGLIKPDAGRVHMFGADVTGATHSVTRRRVGAIIESPAFYPSLSGRDNLRALAMVASGVPAGRIDALLTQVGLAERAKSDYHTYSLGMKQRLGIASTLLTDPPLVILDEPTNGLDPAGQREIRSLIPHLAREGRGVLLASHLLHEVEQVCDRVTIIRRGQVMESGLVHDLLRRDSSIEITVEQPARAAEVARSLPFVERVSVEDGHLIVVAPLDRGAEINRALAAEGLYAGAIVPRTSSLEDLFLELTEAPDTSGDGHDRSTAQ